MTPVEDLEIIELSAADRDLIPSIAKTVCRAFNNDPLIRWLRPHGDDWAQLGESTMKFQCRRIQRSLLRGRVFVTRPKRGVKPASPPRSSPQTADRAAAGQAPIAAVGIMYPGHKGDAPKALAQLRFFLVEFFDPAPDTGGDMERVGIMIKNHDRIEATAKKLAGGRPTRYIEVVAVDPTYQGKKLGGRMLQYMLEADGAAEGGNPVYLECTQSSNVGFYERYGFEVVEESELSGGPSQGAKTGEDSVKLWVMMKRR
ncbi:hypothetical protein VTK73DRAFT_3072 [Phialemonium thermophilum]|uniref:N-acetyltransferase domain-containing protein n=1 Tax=Phialemonium thermophilum TaxID=223376 RepID=A0ABR3VL53_9PEZI